jgi:peptidoglycan hydrolase FlgJ
VIAPVKAQLSAPATDIALKKAAQGFEAVFVRQVIGAMRKAQLASDIFGSNASDSFRELADSRTAESIAQLGQFGIAGMIERQFQTETAQNIENPE